MQVSVKKNKQCFSLLFYYLLLLFGNPILFSLRAIRGGIESIRVILGICRYFNFFYLFSQHRFLQYLSVYKTKQ